MKKLCAILFVLIMALAMNVSTVFAASSPIIDHFGGSKGESFKAFSATKDGGYVAVGDAFSSDGDMEGISKGFSNAVIVKYDAKGHKEWAKTFGGSLINIFYDVKQTRDGGYIAVGSSNSQDGDMADSEKAKREDNPEIPNHDAIIVKFDSKGDIEWFRDFGGSQPDRYNSIIETKDGNYLVVGQTYSYDGPMSGLLKGKDDALIAMYDSKGNLMWFNNFGGRVSESLNSVVECQDGSFVAVGYTNSRDGYMDGTGVSLLKGLIVKFDSSQNIIWVRTEDLLDPEIKTISYLDMYGFTDVEITKDGGFIVCGTGLYEFIDSSRTAYVYSNAHLYKYDSYANKEWDNIYQFYEYGYTNFQSVTQAADGDYIAVGYGHDGGPETAIAVKYDKNGKLLWTKNDGGVNRGYLYDIEAADNSYVIAGTIYTEDKDTEGLLYIGNFEESNGKLILSPETTKAVVSDEPSAMEAPSALSIKAKHNIATVWVDGIPTSLDAYIINENNYFKLRDLAQLLSRTKKKFSVEWDSDKKAISLTSGKAYTPVGAELTLTFEGSDKWAEPATSKMYLDGKMINLTAYTIDGNNYFKLRDVASIMNFGLGWDGTTNAITINTNEKYIK